MAATPANETISIDTPIGMPMVISTTRPAVAATPISRPVTKRLRRRDGRTGSPGPGTGDAPYFVTIAPDIFHKSNVSGSDGFEIDLPHAAADAPLRNTEWGDLTFVEYLRLSFEWAGFPGLKDYERRDEALLASLKEGLLPL
jgi:hypothetical protein